MINGWKFIKGFKPEVLDEDGISVKTEKQIPGYNEIAILRRSESNFKSKEFNSLIDKVFNFEIKRAELIESAGINKTKKTSKKSLKQVEELKSKVTELENRKKEQDDEIFKLKEEISQLQTKNKELKNKLDEIKKQSDACDSADNTKLLKSAA